MSDGWKAASIIAAAVVLDFAWSVFLAWRSLKERGNR